MGIITETDSLKCLGQCRSDKHALAKERMPTAQEWLARMSLRCCQVIRMSLRYRQVMWSGPRAETLEQALSASCISNIKKGTQERVA